MKRILSLFIAGIFATAALQAQSNISVAYGTAVTVNGFKLKNEAGTDWTSSNAVVAVGYFSTTPGVFTAAASTFTNWVTLASSSSFASSGVFNNSGTTVDISGMGGAVGATPYMAVFGGISSIGSLSSATEFGLFRASSWSVVPSGTTPPSTPTSYNLETENFDVLHLGGTLAGQGITAGGNAYTTVAAVPEPSTYALIFGGAVLGFAVYHRRKQRA